MNILVIDVGGTNVKLLATGQEEPRKVPSGPAMTPERMVEAVKEVATDWPHEVISIGYPGFVWEGRPVVEPYNLGRGWVGFDFQQALNRPVKVINDAAMQALGSYEGGRMLFLGLGTGLGSSLVYDGRLVPLELAHLHYRKRRTFEDYLGLRGLRRLGKKKWRRHVSIVVAQLKAAMQAEEVVLGGGNAKLLKELPAGSRLGNNANAFLGGYRLWEEGPRPALAGQTA